MAAFNLEALAAKGGIVDSRLVPFTKVWKHYDEALGEHVEDEVSFFVRKSSYADFARTRVTDGTGLRAEVLQVAACIRLGEEGQEQMTYEQAESLEFALFQLFMEAVAEVYNGASADPKTSARKTNSGAKSSLRASAAGRSRKRKSA